MQVENAFVSGSLGRAVFSRDGSYSVLDAYDAEPRDSKPNEIYMFRHVARELKSVHPEGLPVQLEQVREVLKEEVIFFRGLDGLLIGMDPEMSDKIRRRGIFRANQALAENKKIAERIAQRFFVPVDFEAWDPAGGMKIAQEDGAVHAETYYRLLEGGEVDQIVEDITISISEFLGSGVEAANCREYLMNCGLIWKLLRMKEIGLYEEKNIFNSILDKDVLKFADSTTRAILVVLAQQASSRWEGSNPIKHHTKKLSVNIDNESVLYKHGSTPYKKGLDAYAILLRGQSERETSPSLKAA